MHKDKLLSEFPCVVKISGFHDHSPECPVVTDFPGTDYACLDHNAVEEAAQLFRGQKLSAQFRLNVKTVEEFRAAMKPIEKAAGIRFVVKAGTFRNKCNEFAWNRKFVCHNGGRSKYKNMGYVVLLKQTLYSKSTLF